LSAGLAVCLLFRLTWSTALENNRLQLLLQSDLSMCLSDCMFVCLCVYVCRCGSTQQYRSSTQLALASVYTSH